MPFRLLLFLDHYLLCRRPAYAFAGEFLHRGYCAKALYLFLSCQEESPKTSPNTSLGILADTGRASPQRSQSRTGNADTYKCAIIHIRVSAAILARQIMEERDFFDERQEKKPASLNCPHCHQSAEYEVTWVVRTKKRQLAGRADDRDRARFAKFRSYMVRKDDVMACKNMRCRKRFDISGQSTVIME